MKTIAIVHLKGGVGKTAITFNVGCALSKLGYKTLMVDFDAQSDLSWILDCDHKADKGLGNLLDDYLKGNVSNNFDAYISHDDKNHVDLIAGTHYLESMMRSFNESSLSDKEKHMVLRSILNSDYFKSKYDFILFDCKTTLDIGAASIIEASDYAIIPTILEYRPVNNVFILTDKIDNSFNCKLLGIVVNRVKCVPMTKMTKDLWEQLRQEYGNQLFETYFTEQPNAHESAVLHYGAVNIEGNKAAESFMNLTREILERIKEV